MNNFLLHELKDEKLDIILNLTDSAQVDYFSNLIEQYYPNMEPDTDNFYELLISYKSSFVLEKKYRKNETIQNSFTAVYTRTGLIRELVNDLYYTEDSLIIH